MPDESTKISKFLEAIDKYAKEQRDKLNSEAERIRKEEEIRIEDEILGNAYKLIQREMAEMHTEISKEYSNREIEVRRKIFKQRLEIMEEVFDKAYDKLIAFTKSDSYEKFLKDVIHSVLETLSESDLVLHLRSEDQYFVDTLKSSCKIQCEFRIDDSIKLGGIKGYSKAQGIIVDETLDARLKDQREWFIENSGLILR